MNAAVASLAAQIEMYTTSWCPYCERARSLLRAKGAAFTEFNIESDASQREIMIRRSGQRSVPQIFINGAHIGGSDDLHALNAAGGLDPLLHAAAVTVTSKS